MEARKYRIMNRTTHQWWEGEADSAVQACQKAGWPKEDCWVREHSDTGSGGWRKPSDAPELGRRR